MGQSFYIPSYIIDVPLDLPWTLINYIRHTLYSPYIHRLSLNTFYSHDTDNTVHRVCDVSAFKVCAEGARIREAANANGGMVPLCRNIISAGPSIIRKPGTFRSNLELTNSLRNHFVAAQQDYSAALENGNGNHIQNGNHNQPNKNGNGNENGYKRPAAEVWTARGGDEKDSALYIPRIDWSSAGLHEERTQYEITVKLFYLQTASAGDRPGHTQEALSLVKKELGVDDVDLLIVSFPGISFEGDCEWEADRLNATMGDDGEELATWAALEALQRDGRVGRLGLAEFGSEKLRRFLDGGVQVRPAVNQINVKNCCSVPPPLTQLAKEENIELFTHNDCTDILPSGTLRELLGQGAQGAGVLADDTTDSSGIRGDLIPQWVVKYTAVVKDRGVIENKGYFAGAELVEA